VESKITFTVCCFLVYKSTFWLLLQVTKVAMWLSVVT